MGIGVPSYTLYYYMLLLVIARRGLFTGVYGACVAKVQR